jgi:uncharacterized protein (DUF427 family)
VCFTPSLEYRGRIAIVWLNLPATARPIAQIWPEKDRQETMAKATWNGKVIAEGDTFETVEGNIYFPESAVKREFIRPSSTTSTCPWKGQARYYSLLVDGQENPDAAWYYPDPKPAAKNIKNHVAFWRGVEMA